MQWLSAAFLLSGELQMSQQEGTEKHPGEVDQVEVPFLVHWCLAHADCLACPEWVAFGAWCPWVNI